MSEFINTIDLLGDDVVVDSIINKTITEFKDDQTKTIGAYAFYKCSELTKVDAPNVTTVESRGFCDCTALEEVSLPSASAIKGEASFQNCSALENISLPSVVTLAGASVTNCKALQKVSFSMLSALQYRTFQNCTSLKALILRNTDKVCTNNTAGSNDAFSGTQIASGSGYIYVPRALVDSYKVATNWSVYAAQFRALEDYTVDGTTSGKFAGGTVNLDLQGVYSSNTDDYVVNSYQTTLSTLDKLEIKEVSVFMDGVDITKTAYNNGIVYIPKVLGAISIIARCNINVAVWSIPLNGEAIGVMPYYRIDVTAGQKLRLHYHVTKNTGYIYDGRACGLGYKNSGLEVDTDAVMDLTVPSDGYMTFGITNANSNVPDFVNGGTTIGTANDKLNGKYLLVEILE